MSRNTVVVAEDEPLIRRAASELLTAAGISVVGFADGDAAIDYLRDHKAEVAAVFADLCLPGDTDGLELAGIVSEACPDIAVLVTSDSHRERPAQLGARVRYLPKPWLPGEVLSVVSQAVRAAA